MTMTWIQGTTASGSSNTLSLVSIPSTFTHLQVRLFGRSSNASATTTYAIQLNSDGGSNYAWHFLGGDGSGSAQSSAGATQTSMNFQNIVANSATTGIFSASIIDILDYTSTVKNKTVRALNGFDANGSGNVYLNSGLWFNSSIAAINRIDLILATGNWLSGSRVDLYGITTSELTGA